MALKSRATAAISSPPSMRARTARSPCPTRCAACRKMDSGRTRRVVSTVEAMEASAARLCAAHGATYDWQWDPERIVPPFPGVPDSRAVEMVRAAAATVPGVTFAAEEAQATLEANYLAAGTDVVAVASGGRVTFTDLRQIPPRGRIAGVRD